jgi:hypothetical protein
MSDSNNARTQYDFIIDSHYTPAQRRVQNSTGLDVNSRSVALQDTLYSTATQHGSGGANTVWRRAVSNAGGPNASDEAIIQAVYAERGANNGTKYFPSSTAAVRRSVVNRFAREERDAQSMLRAEKGSS